MIIKKVTDIEFKEYGQVLENYDFQELIGKMETATLPVM